MNSGESARSAEATAQFGPQPRLPDSEPMEARQKLVDFTYPLVNLQKTMENHHFEWENPLFQWSFSIAMLVYQRVIHWVIILITSYNCSSKIPINLSVYDHSLWWEAMSNDHKKCRITSKIPTFSGDPERYGCCFVIHINYVHISTKPHS